MRRKRGLMMVSAATVRSGSDRRALVRLIPVIGKTEKVKRNARVSTLAGRLDRTCARRARTCSSDWSMSTRQLKKTLTTLEPRPVLEGTLSTPGASFIASSIGLVIMAIISSAGISPLSPLMVARGEMGCGEKPEGIDDAE